MEETVHTKEEWVLQQTIDSNKLHSASYNLDSMHESSPRQAKLSAWHGQFWDIIIFGAGLAYNPQAPLTCVYWKDLRA